MVDILVQILRTPEAARFVALSPSTLEKMRLTGAGPPFIRLGARAVGYDVNDLREWLRSRRASSTSDAVRLEAKTTDDPRDGR